MDDRPKLLLIDDGEIYAEAIARQLPEFQLLHPGFVEQPRVPDGLKALSWLARHADLVDALLLDMRFDVPDADLLPLPEAQTPRRQRRYQGVAILRALRERHPHLPVVLLTGVADLAPRQLAAELASTSLTYLLDGDDLDALRIPISQALRDARRDTEEGEILWGRDPHLRAIRRRLGVLARGRLPVILEGETGTGKSFLAERLLHARSGRVGAFITLDLSTLPVDLIPAHLFGVTRGAYTGAVADRKGAFELADGGTLFID
ncbi:sigma 54-interacting transcriptional regulator, partial [Myxococcota bacterium]|nr:sigma 54-interacting transcriptional regulator [Myxococcota bacterium]